MSWDGLFERERDELIKINKFLSEDEETYRHTDIMILPPKDKRFLAFENCPLEDVKVCIYGQDPYHTRGVAHGLCFSIESGGLPPSLRNIFRELKDDLGIVRTDGNLTNWSKQGVLLLNSALSVVESKPNSHAKIWRTFTDSVIQHISDTRSGVVFILWGSFAKNKIKFIDTQKHHVLTSTHPSPLSANRGGFFGCKHFSTCNHLLNNQGLSQISW